MKLSQFSTLGLLGAINGAASPLSVSTTNFPKYTTALTLAAGDKDGNFIKDTWFKDGTNMKYLERGLRNDFDCFPTQNVVRPTITAGTEAFTLANSSTGRTWYQTAAAQIGSYGGTAKPITTTPTSDAEATTLNGQTPSGLVWAVCQDSADKTGCKWGGQVSAAKSTTNWAVATAAIASQNRIYIKRTNPTTALTYVTTGTVKASVVWTYNWDFLFGALYQEDYGATVKDDGTKWCSNATNKVLKDGTELTGQATNGFNAKAKCTFQFTAEDHSVGLGFKLATLDYANIFIQWAEWIKAAGLGTNGVLGAAADTSNFKIGTYAAPASGGVWVNPVTQSSLNSGTWKGNTQAYNIVDYTVSSTTPGGRGNLAFYPALTGQFKETQIENVSSFVVDDMYAQQVTRNSDYTTLLNDFETKRNDYNPKADKEAARRADAFKMAFEPAVLVPSRPCPPTRPKAWDSWNLDYGRYIGTGSTAWAATATAQKKYLGVVNMATGTATYATSDVYYTRMGALRASADTSKTTVDNVAHLFGKFGQGEATDYAKMGPFYWGAETSGDLSTIQVTILAGDSGDTGLSAAAKYVKFTAKGVAWVKLDTFKPPSQPAAAGSLSKDPFAGAKMLASSAIAALAVASSLY